MLDGLDEVAASERGTIEARIVSFATACPGSQVIVSTRSTETRLQSHFVCWTLLSPTEQDVVAFFQHRLGDRAKPLVNQLREKLGSLSHNPFVLDLIAANPDIDLTSVAEPGKALGKSIDRVLARIGGDPRGLAPDVARLLLQRMV